MAKCACRLPGYTGHRPGLISEALCGRSYAYLTGFRKNFFLPSAQMSTYKRAHGREVPACSQTLPGGGQGGRVKGGRGCLDALCEVFPSSLHNLNLEPCMLWTLHALTCRIAVML